MADETYVVQRSITIDAAPESIYKQIVDFHRWTAWSPWEDVDPALNRGYTGAAEGVGAVYTWSGNRKAGQGRMEMIEAVEPGRIRIDLVFEKPFKAHNDTVFTIVPETGGCRVTWWMSGKKTLMTKVMGIFTSMDDLLGPDFDKGLTRLKAAVHAAAGS